MAEYIEREAAIKTLRGKCVAKYPMSFSLGLFAAADEIESIPAADVVPVVRCKDCLHYEMGVCLKIYDDGAANKDAWQERNPDDFCSYGDDYCVDDMRPTSMSGAKCVPCKPTQPECGDRE